MPIDIIRFIALASQVALHVMLLAASLMVTLGVGWSYAMSGERCPLGATVHYCPKTPGDPNSAYVLNRTVAGLPEWGSDHVCGYCTYSAVVTSIYTVIFMWFILLRSGWKEVTTPRVMAIRPVKLDVRALVASLLLSLTMSISLLTSAVFSLRILLKGIEQYCSGIIASFPGKTCGDDYVWERIDEPPNTNIHQYLEVAKVSNIIMVAVLSLHLLLVIWRVFLLIRERLALDDDAKNLLDQKRKNRATQIEVIDNDSCSGSGSSSSSSSSDEGGEVKVPDQAVCQVHTQCNDDLDIDIEADGEAAGGPSSSLLPPDTDNNANDQGSLVSKLAKTVRT